MWPPEPRTIRTRVAIGLRRKGFILKEPCGRIARRRREAHTIIVTRAARMKEVVYSAEGSGAIATGIVDTRVKLDY